MEDEEWIRRLRERLEDYEEAPPTELWEAISKQLGLEEEPVRKPTIIRRWHWVAAAAAAVLTLVGFFVFQEKTEEPTAPLQTDAKTILKKNPSPQTPSQPMAVITPSSTSPRMPAQAIVLNQPVSEVEKEPEATPEPTPAPETAIPQPKPFPLPEDMPETEEPQRDSHTWTIGLNSSGGLLAANSTEQNKPIPVYSDLSNGGYSSYDMTAGNHATTYHAEHRLPIRFGLSLNYQLSTRAMLLTGLNYTYLFSRFTATATGSSREASYDQRLNYLGIPVGIAYQLWEAKRFRIYAVGGLELDKCLDENPWQLSVSAAVGGEYAILRQLGAYLEPSLGYYFDDGSMLEHYYKEHPLAPAIQFGLRLHLK